MTTLILGLGNPDFGDDGFGPLVVEGLRPRLGDRPDVELDTLCAAGLTAVERMTGHDRVVLIDALDAGLEPGTLWVGPLDALPGGAALGSHDLSLPAGLRMARGMGLPVPREVIAVTAQLADAAPGRNVLSPAVAAAVSPAARAVCELIDAGERHALARSPATLSGLR